MARKYKLTRSSGYTIVLADDDPDYLEATRLLLESEGHEVLCAKNGSEALALLRERHAHLLLLDYFMPGMTGEEVVGQLRKDNPVIQVILQTGYVNERPPREMLRRLDIQGYYDKSEGPDRLLLWTDAGLKAASAVLRLYQGHKSLRFLLDAAPSMHKIQPLGDLTDGILRHFAGLLTAGDVLPGASPAPEVDGFVALCEDESEMILVSAAGSFAAGQRLEEALPAEDRAAVAAVAERGEPELGAAFTALPLRLGGVSVGIVFLRAPALLSPDPELLELFADQATTAIRNVQLYEMATLDPLTGVYARRFFDRWILREVQAAFRSRVPLSMLILDLDDLKAINDTSGHLAGDQALVTMGKVLRQATRETDVVARYGGDEFVIILPQTTVEDAERIGQRVLSCLEDKTVPATAGPKPLRTSAGLSVLPSHAFTPADLPQPFSPKYFQEVAQELVRQADGALYQAKRMGRGRLCVGAPASWTPVS